MVDDNKYKTRIIDPEIKRYLDTFGAVCIEGIKWCGKTRTSMRHTNSYVLLGDPTGNFQNRQLAQISPATVLAGPQPRLIDEWQEVPSLWDAVRASVDHNPVKGQFLLTGSATPNHKGVLHSGAGRIARLRMRPMSLFESGDSSGLISLKEVCEGRLTPVMTGEVDLRKIIRLILRGGWPKALSLANNESFLLPGKYLKDLINNNAVKADGVKRDTEKMWIVLRSLARHESSTTNKASLLKDIHEKSGVHLSHNTLDEYLYLFKRLFLTDNIEPFSASGLRSALRVKQAEKLHFTDPSLACSLLGATEDNLLGDLQTLGFLFEALCERDLRIYAQSFGSKLYHYQDYANQEIDAVIAHPDGSWTAVEIKLGANQIDEAAHKLLKIKKKLEQASKNCAPKQLIVLTGMSNSAYQRPDGVFVLPLLALKP